MKKKILLGTLVAFASVLALAGCDNGGGTSELKLNLAYGNKDQTITYQKSNPLTLPGGTVITQGQLKPFWSYVANELNMTIKDNTTQDQKASQMITTAAATGFSDSDIYGGNSIGESLMSYGTQGFFVDLTELMNQGKMPHVKAFLDNNPDIKSAITAYNGKIYHLPYIAEIGSFARDYHMRESWVTSLLDTGETADKKYDTDKTLTTYYEGFWKGNNARTGTNGGTVTPKDGVNITKKTNENVITLMNNLPTKNGKTLADCLKTYIKNNYSYTKASELYLGEKAAYDVDELVALFRVIKANPKFLTSGKAETVWPYFTRQSSYREELLRFGTYFNGIRVHGSDSYSARWEIDKNGQIQYTYTKEDFFDILTYLSQWQAEGLIYDDVYDTTNKNNFRNQLYFADNAENPKFGFMTFDFTASTTADGATAADVRDIVGVLPPVSKVNGVWQYYIDNSRVIKPDGWAISAKSNNIDKAAELFDYFFTEDGAVLQNYGLPEMLKENEKFTGPDGKEVPAYNEWTLNTTKEVANGDLSTFLRNFIGALMPVGYSKEIGFEYQYTSERGFDAWELLINSTTGMPSYEGTGPKGDNPNYYKLIPPVFSLTERQSDALANTQMTSNDSLYETIFNIIRYKAKGNAPTSVTLPADYNAYYKLFKDAGVETYIQTYQDAYTAMQAIQNASK